MSVQQCITNKTIEVVDDIKIRTTITTSESVATPNKSRVYKGTSNHFTSISEKDIPTTSEEKELYYSLEEGKEMPLDKFRLVARDEGGKQLILDGLLELMFLVSEGKIYNIELNPLNFIAEDQPSLGKITVKAFYRESKGLREITDEWLYNAKKIIGYFLVSDTGFNEENYNYLKPSDFLNEMSGDVYDTYLMIMKSTTVDKMAREWFTGTVYKQLKGFPPIMKDYRKPRERTSVGVNILGNESPEPEEIPQTPPPPSPVEKIEVEEDKPEKIETLDLEEGDFDGDKNKKSKQRRRVVPATYRKAKGGGGKKVLYVIGVVLIGWLLYYIFFSGGISTVKVGGEYYKGLVNASVQKYEEATQHFDTMTTEEINDFSSEEKVSVFFSYLMSEQFERALEIEPEGVESVITYLNRNERLEEIEQIESNLPAIGYEKAVLAGEYDEVIKLKDEVKDITRRQEDIVEAFVKTGDVESAIEYAKLKDLEDAEGKIKEYFEEYVETEEVPKEERENMEVLIEAM